MTSEVDVDLEITRNPAVREERDKWNLPAPDSEGVTASPPPHAPPPPPKLPVGGGQIAEVEQLFQAEEAVGWTTEVADDETRRIYGDRCCVCLRVPSYYFASFVASLAVVNEPGHIPGRRTMETMRSSSNTASGPGTSFDPPSRGRITPRSGRRGETLAPRARSSETSAGCAGGYRSAMRIGNTRIAAGARAMSG